MGMVAFNSLQKHDNLSDFTSYIGYRTIMYMLPTAELCCDIRALSGKSAIQSQKQNKIYCRKSWCVSSSYISRPRQTSMARNRV